MLLSVQNDILCTLDDGYMAVLILLDLSAAFDTINHTVLLQRLRQIGITGKALEWFQSYLQGRFQYISINGVTSESAPLECGVPQGSVMGPLLFLVYLLPLGKLLTSHGTSKYGFADDTQMFFAFKRPSNAALVRQNCMQIEQVLNEVYSWMTNNKLKLNADKTEIMLFGSKTQLSSFPGPSLSVAGTEVEYTKAPMRNLGSYFDPQMNMTAHVNQVTKSAAFQLRNIGRVRNCLTMATTKTLIQSLVLSRIDYANGLLGGASDKLLRPLQRIQNNAARIIFRSPRFEHVTPLFVKLHWLPVKARVEYKLLVTVFKALQNQTPSYVRDMLLDYLPLCSLRSASKYLLCELKFKKDTVGGRAFSRLAPRLWNKLKLNIREASTLTSFKTMLKTDLFRRFNI